MEFNEADREAFVYDQPVYDTLVTLAASKIFLAALKASL